MSSMDLYDDLFLDSESNKVDNENCLSLNDNEKLGLSSAEKKLQEDNKKLQEELNTLKQENENWQLVYCDVVQKLENCKTNISTLLKTTHNEIKRKNDTISGLRKELDNILFKRALKSGTVNELKNMIEKIHLAFQFEIDGCVKQDLRSSSAEKEEKHFKQPKQSESTNTNPSRDDMIKEGSNHSFNGQRENSKASKSETRNLANKKDLQPTDSQKKRKHLPDEVDTSSRIYRKGTRDKSMSEREASKEKYSKKSKSSSACSNYTNKSDYIEKFRDKDRRERQKRSPRSPSPKSRSSYSEKYRKISERKYDKENDKNVNRNSSKNSERKSYLGNRSDSKRSITKKWSNDSSSSTNKTDVISKTEAQTKPTEMSNEILNGEYDNKKNIHSDVDIEDGEISEEENVENNLINELGQTAGEGPNCKYNNLDTNDLENLIKAKQQEMNQLKEEESTLLQRKRRYVSSKEKCPIKVNS